MIEAEGLAKACPGRSAALAGVSFAVGRGEVFGLLGPDARARPASTGLHWMGVRPYDDGQTPILGARGTHLEALVSGNGMMMMVPVIVIVLAALVYLGARRRRRGSGAAGQQQTREHR